MTAGEALGLALVAAMTVAVTYASTVFAALSIIPKF